MKHCDLCDLDNPDEARFCMKCGKDLDPVPRSSDVPPEMFDTFTPSGAEGTTSSRLSGVLRGEQSPQLDHAAYLEREVAEAEKLGPLEEEQYTGDSSELSMTDVTSDFAERKIICKRCGVANPRDQRFCRNCGSSLIPEDQTDADYAHDTSMASMPLAKEPVETSLLTDVTPASDYYPAEAPPVQRERRLKRERRPRGSGGGLELWGAREWIALIFAIIFLAAIIWFFFFGGMELAFSGKLKNINKARATMLAFPSFQYSLDATFENPQTGQYSGTGILTREAPDKASSEFTINIPGREPVHHGWIQVGTKTYILTPNGWQPAGSENVRLEPVKLWDRVSSVEDLGNQAVGGLNCFHYKYRIPPEIITGLVGVYEPKDVSDAVMEEWIDSLSFRVVKMTAVVYNVDIEGVRTRVSMTFDLTAVGEPYDIKAPI